MSGVPPASSVPSAQEHASHVLAELITLGVTHVVVCPGSRSQALALAAADAERLGLITLHVRLDERSAGFLALGIARETGIPAPVIVTSGTAVVNLLPAVSEAHHARVPMILLTADRPDELRGIRSSQTMSDRAFMRPFTRFFADLSADASISDVITATGNAFRQSVGDARGPAQLNLSFRDPLSHAETGLEDAVAARLAAGNPGVFRPEVPRDDVPTYVHGNTAPNTVVVAGADAGAQAEAFAHAANVPLLAEPSSGARFGREAIQHWETLLQELRAERIIVFGHPTLTRTVPRLVQEIPTVVIDEAIESDHDLERFNPGNRAQGFAAQAEVAEDYDRESRQVWLREWVTRDRQLRAEHTTVHEPDLEGLNAKDYKSLSAYSRQEVARLRKLVSREHLTETVWLATWPHDRLVVASSRLIRVLNRQAAPRNISVHANRGLAGIDGTIATALGIALASQSNDDPKLAAGTTRVITGDLAFFHDVGSLALPEGERPRIQIIVGNDGGGTIFDMLEVAGSAAKDAFDRVMLTPQQVNIAELAAAYGWTYRKAENRGELERAMTVPVTGPEILEIPIER